MFRCEIFPDFYQNSLQGIRRQAQIDHTLDLVQLLSQIKLNFLHKISLRTFLIQNGILVTPHFFMFHLRGQRFKRVFRKSQYSSPPGYLRFF